MAYLKARRSQNVDGEFYVDSSCLNCDTCRWLAPDTFDLVEGQSAVVLQPETERDLITALQALLSRPTASICAVMPPRKSKRCTRRFPFRWQRMFSIVGITLIARLGQPAI